MLRLTLGFHDFAVQKIRIGLEAGSHAREHLFDCLVELRFTGIAGLQAGHETGYVFFCESAHYTKVLISCSLSPSSMSMTGISIIV